MAFYEEWDVEPSAKRKRFCHEYLKDLNATQAAIRAGYSKKTAYSIGSELIHHPPLRRYINGLAQMQRIRTNVTSDLVLKELKKIAFAKDGITTREKLKALEMLGRHTGFFDKPGEVPVELSERPAADGSDTDLADPGSAVLMLLDQSERNRCFESLWNGFAADPESFRRKTWVQVMQDMLGYQDVRESVNRRLESMFVTRRPYP